MPPPLPAELGATVRANLHCEAQIHAQHEVQQSKKVEELLEQGAAPERLSAERQAQASSLALQLAAVEESLASAK